jgi:hypothetical protein
MLAEHYFEILMKGVQACTSITPSALPMPSAVLPAMEPARLISVCLQTPGIHDDALASVI